MPFPIHCTGGGTGCHGGKRASCENKFEELIFRPPPDSVLPACSLRPIIPPKCAMSTCPVCLVASSPSIELACGHALCHACGTAAAAFGIEACPVCRRASVLDPALLRAESAAWRSSYQNWRAGREKGAAGEVSSVSVDRAMGRQPTLVCEWYSNCGRGSSHVFQS